MKLPAIATAFWMLFIYLITLVYRASDSLVVTIVVLAAYIFLSHECMRRQWQVVWLRDSRLVKLLCALLSDVPTDLQLHARQTIYAVAPHGLACLGFATAFVPSRDGRVRLLASPLFLMVPILRDLYMLGGVVSSNVKAVTACMERGESVAVIPCGMRGLHAAVVEEHCADTRVIDVLRINHGFARFAIAYGTLLVPVLSLGEQEAFAKTSLTRYSPFWSTLAVPTLRRVRTLHGAPIDATAFTDTRQLADAYYAALRELGKRAGYEVNVIVGTRDDSTRKPI